MKIITINLSGNVGKTLSARSLLSPRIKDAEIFSVESANSDGQEDVIIKGKRFSQLMQAVGVVDNAIVDVGASNAEDFLWAMKQQRGSHEDFDYFVVPTIGKTKQLSDTINTITELAEIGVNQKRIKVILNQVEYDDVLEELFAGIFKFQKESKLFSICKSVIHSNELFPLLVKNKISISDLISDETDYKAKIKETKDINERLAYVEMLGLKRLASGVNDELNSVFKDLVTP
jgi:hypothetical protein